MIDLSDIVSDPEFARPFTINRSTGQFALGGYQAAVQQIQAVGVIRPAGAQDIEIVPEGDRTLGMMTFWSATEMNTTSATGTSDVLTYQGIDYRVLQVMPSGDFGYWKAIAARKSGD
ncbi:MAG TPA: hypothetical protein VKX25_19440 [Bryobacteraceae bacterium]|jgi:hypothetical protein|nr:hypothetical protein [Bryobacteraceae bacterium]